MHKRKKMTPPKRKRQPGCTWDDEDSALLLKLLLEQTARGAASENGFREVTYAEVANELEVQRPCTGKKVPKNGKSAKAHFAKVRSFLLTASHRTDPPQLKGLFKIFEAIKTASGFGWDPLTKTVTAPDDVWERYILAHPKAAQFKDTPFPLYDDLFTLCANVIAIGVTAFNASRRRRQRSESPRDSDSADSDEDSDDDNLPGMKGGSPAPSWEDSDGADEAKGAAIVAPSASKKVKRTKLERPPSGPPKSISLVRTSSVTENDCSGKSGPPKRRRPTQTGVLIDLEGVLHTIVGKIDDPPPPPYRAPPPPPPIAEDVLSRAIRSVQDEASNIAEKDQAVIMDMFIEDTKAATAWLAMKAGPVRDTWVDNRINWVRNRRDVQPVQPGLC